MKNLKSFLFALVSFTGLTTQSLQAQSLYTQIGTDVPFAQLINEKILPVGVDSTVGVKGSSIDVDNALVEVGAYAKNNILHEMRIQTVANYSIRSWDYPKWTRWYQEDGNTQVLRLFKGEYNVHDERTQAARIEAHAELRWGRGAWHEWVGRITIVKPMGASIFQVFNSVNQWALQIGMGPNGDIVLNHRRHQEDQIIARNMEGKGFDLRIRDNGHDYEVYMNGIKVGAGFYDRPAGETSFKWGMYVGASDVTQDGMIFVTGATVDPQPSADIAVTNVSLSPATLNLKVGQKSQLIATVFPANATHKSVTFSTSNPRIATVNASGIITAIASGNVVIQVKTVNGNKTDSTLLTVASPATSSRPSSKSQSSSVRSLQPPSSRANSSVVSVGSKCKYIVASEWNTGFTATIRITNTSTSAINGWKVNWSFSDGSKVTSSWNAILTGNNPYGASNVSWNSSIQPGQFVELGFQGNKGSTNAQIPIVTGGVCQ